MKLSDDDFWRLTLKEFNYLCDRHNEERRANLYNSALICSVIANVNRKKGKSFKPSDFMPKIEKKKQMTIEEMVEVLKQVTAQNGGEVNC